jgi:dipeptidyl aminopeptidase/acylaminoacyl peptidase
VFVLALLLVLPIVADSAEKRPIRETDLLAFTWIGDSRISPDGKQVVFVRVTVNEDKDRYETALWMVPTDGKASPRAFTSGPFDSSPRWSPDGQTLAFVRSEEKDGKPGESQVWLIPISGGEAHALTSVAKGASGPAWSPDGRRIAFKLDDPSRRFRQRRRGEEEERRARDHTRDLPVQRRGVHRPETHRPHFRRRQRFRRTARTPSPGS